MTSKHSPQGADDLHGDNKIKMKDSEKHYNRNERELKKKKETVEQTDGKGALEERDSERIEKKKLKMTISSDKE